MQLKQVADAVTIAASAAYTETNTGTTAVYLPGMINGVVLECDLTAAATASGDLCDVYVQTTVDGTNYVDVAHFTQMLGNGGAKRYYMKVNAGAAMTGFENAAALGANAVRDIIGDKWRIRVVVTPSGTTGDESFTLSVTAMPM